MPNRPIRSPRNHGARIREETSHGHRLVTLENERLRVGVLAGKGADIVELLWKPHDLDLIWIAPGGIRPPEVLAAAGPDDRAAFRDTYPGGWQEIFPNGGLPCTHAGAAHAQHGEVHVLSWDVALIADSEQEVAVAFSVRANKVPCLLTRTIRLRSGQPGFEVTETLVNESPVPVEVMWGHHITFGAPFMVPGCTIDLPPGVTVQPHATPIAPGGRRLAGAEPFPWPREPGSDVDLSVVPESGTPSEQVYLTGFPDDAWYTITRPDGVGARVAWDARTMPFLWFWQEFGRSTGYPWFGRLNVIGLEPFAGMPNLGLAEAVANGSALTLAPHEERAFRLTFEVTGG